MKNYLFTVYLIGVGENVDEAWQDATEATNLSNDPTPDPSNWSEIY